MTWPVGHDQLEGLGRETLLPGEVFVAADLATLGASMNQDDLGAGLTPQLNMQLLGRHLKSSWVLVHLYRCSGAGHCTRAP